MVLSNIKIVIWYSILCFILSIYYSYTSNTHHIPSFLIAADVLAIINLFKVIKCS